MKKIICAAALCTFCALSFAETKPYRASIDEAAIYLQGATLSQTVSVPVKAGAQDVVIDGLAPSIDMSSLKVKAPGVLISSSEFYVGSMTDEASAAKAASLEKEIASLKSDIAATTSSKETQEKMLQILADGIDNQVRNASTGDVAAKLEAYRTNAEKINAQILSLKEELASKNSQLEVLSADLKEVKAQNARKCGMLKLSLSASAAKNVEFQISYYTGSACWSPKYEITVASLDKPASLQAKAMVSQTTGLDWKNVHMTLSNGRPGTTNLAPTLSTWFLRYREEMVYRAKMMNVACLAATADEAEACAPMAAESMDEYVELTETALSVNYAIALPYNVPGDGKKQSIDLKGYSVDAEYYYYAVPKVSDEVYLMAKLSDWEKYNLLPGEAVVSYDGTFIGKTYLNPSSTSDALLLTLGTDSRIVVTRELASEGKSTKLIGSSTQKSFNWTIAVKNNQNVAVKLRVNDQYPVSTDKDIEVNAGKTPSGASVDSSTGLITWDLDLAAGESRQLQFNYSVKYPKDKNISL